MKHIIYILRHAKSKSGSSDYERKLSKKGVADAKMLAAWMRQFQHRPDTIISSSAVRGRHTASIMAASLSIGEENVSYVQNLYGATTGRWLQRLRRLDERQVQHVLLVGHNPELELLAAKLAAVTQLQLPPCGMVAIQSRHGWAKLGTADSTLLCSHYPERYMELRPEFVSITSQAVQAAVACLPAAARGGDAKHLLGEGIYGAIAKIMAPPKKTASKAARKKKSQPKKTASKAASVIKEVAAEKQAKPQANRAAQKEVTAEKNCKQSRKQSRKQSCKQREVTAEKNRKQSRKQNCKQKEAAAEKDRKQNCKQSRKQKEAAAEKDRKQNCTQENHTP
ncbi:MAG: histidine phosphatase family protein [Candidatus Porifericomitaceae bacterium WSBS_2022_MAG_OTU9]